MRFLIGGGGGTTLEVPAGLTTSTAWNSTRRDCVLADPSAEETSVTCNAGPTTAVTLTVTDSTGAKITRSTSLTLCQETASGLGPRVGGLTDAKGRARVMAGPWS